MSKEKFESRRMTGQISVRLSEEKIWQADKSSLVNSILKIVSRYIADGYVLTLRQLYYQLVSREIIPNHDKVYKKLSSILDDCRYSGLIDWSAIEDRGRVPKKPFFVDDIEEALNLIANQYKLDRQLGQQNHVEIWTEKDAISGILERVTSKYGINLCVNKGYTSSSAMHSAYKRFASIIKDGRKICILYFGDHDPSGLDMVRDIRERLLFMFCNGNRYASFVNDIEDFCEEENIELYDEKEDIYLDSLKRFFEDRFSIVPIGLTMEQIKKYNPPPNPAKITDPRAAWYIKKFGRVSWEVDALSPDIMISIAEECVKQNINLVKYEKMLQREQREKKQILSFVKIAK